MANTYFISDLHLSAQRPDINACLFDFLANQLHDAQALYILGDLFEIWLGDDDISAFSEAIANAIASVSATIPVYFIHGNRDFALGEAFAKRAGMQLLPEQCVIDLYGQAALIMHGDELCTKDIEYQKFRKKARGWWWPKLMRAIPLTIRRKLAQRGRTISKNNQKQLSAEIMDVTQEEVEKVMLEHNVNLLIHGHTHRPNTHHFSLKHKAATRIVLGDWYEQGSYLVANEHDVSLRQIAFSFEKPVS